jgi:mRNA interferase RelE/StbE
LREFSVTVLRRAQRELGDVSSPDFERVCDAVRALASDPRPAGCTKLAGREGWRIRVGDYRVLYDVDDATGVVCVVHIGHRRDVYR